MSFKTAAKIAIGLFIFALLVVFIGPERIVTAAAKANPWLLLAGALVTPVTISLRLLRWRSLTAVAGKKLPFGKTSSFYMIGMFFGTITPSKLGELVKVHYLGKQGMTKSEALSITLCDRFFDVVVTVAFSVMGIMLISGGLSAFAPSAAIFVALLLLATYAAFNRRIFMFFGRAGMRLLNPLFMALMGKNAGHKELENFYGPLDTMKRKPAIIGYVSLLTVLIWITCGIQMVVLLSAFGPQIGFEFGILATCLGALTGLIPVTISGIGVRDATQIAVFAMAGVGSSVSLLSAIFFTLFGMGLPSIAGGFLYMLSNKREWDSA